MKKSTLFLFLLAATSLFFYIRFTGLSWKSLYMLMLANGFGVCFFAIILSTIGARMAKKAAENIDKRINDVQKYVDYDAYLSENE